MPASIGSLHRKEGIEAYLHMASPLTTMADELYRAAVKGDNLSVLSDENIARLGEAYYRDQTTLRKSTIVHIAAEHGRTEFIRVALARFPQLACAKNTNGDTPLHVAARKGYEEVVKLLVSSFGVELIAHQNVEGDTALHLALSNNRLRLAMDLLHAASASASASAGVLSLVNASYETSLHIFVKYCIGTHATADALLEEGVLNLQGVYKTKSHIISGRSSSSSSSSSMLIEGVLTKLLMYKPAAFVSDAKGLTPLLIAAQQGSFLVMRYILSHCPQSAETCDHQGRTMLHHLRSHRMIPSQRTLYVHDHDHDYDQQPKELKASMEVQSISYSELKDLLSFPEIDAIKDTKDSRGNTAAHVALANADIVLVKVLFECFADFTIKNKDGVSALELIKSFPDFATKMEEAIVTEKMFNKMLDSELIQAAVKGDVAVFEGACPITDIESGEIPHPDHDDDRFLGRTRQGLSILHLAVKHGHRTFMEESIKRFPTLVLAADSSGDTALHVAARLNRNLHYPVGRTLLQLTKDCVDKFREEVGPLFVNALPWRQKNCQGNTPLHEALRTSNYDIASYLIEVDSELPLFKNNAGETPLHVLARHGTYTKQDKIHALVAHLIGRNESMVYEYDTFGFTPLLRAAYCGRIRVAFWISFNYLASVKFRDPNGRTFLHLLRLEPTAELDLLRTEDMLYMYTNILSLMRDEFDDLRSSQDHDGNTPLHFALKNSNFGAAKFLLLWCIKSESRQEMSIINNEGHSISNLLELLPDNDPHVKGLKNLASLAQKQLKEQALGKKAMDEDVYQAAVKGDMRLFHMEQQHSTSGDETDRNSMDDGDNDRCSNLLYNQVAPDGSSILHLAIQYGQMEFAKEVMRLYPDLICDRDHNGDIPLHTAAKLWNEDVCELHAHFQDAWNTIRHKYQGNPEGFLVIPPWRVKNSQGNTPLHAALKSQNSRSEDSSLSTLLLLFDSQVATHVNDAGETPLHIIARGFFTKNIIGETLVSKCSPAAYMRDIDGLTPLLRAAKACNIHMANKMLASSPQSIQLKDFRGKSFLHLLQFTNDEMKKKQAVKIYKIPEVDALRKTEDIDGNTPLHLAIQNGDSVGAKLLAERCSQADDTSDATKLIKARNNHGQSVLDLLSSHDDAPTKVVQLLINKQVGFNVYGLYLEGKWIRSSYGVCRSQIKDMANTLSVVAGLLATITFAAAFQIPGSYDDNSGIPVLITRAAFQAFMISNSLAMCGSMLVLFSLLWIKFTGSAVKSFLLVDLAIALLQLSLGATLFAFMTGVYVAISHKALWLAIFICTLCSTAIVLMRKRFILHITLCLQAALVSFGLCRKKIIIILSKVFPRIWIASIWGINNPNAL